MLISHENVKVLLSVKSNNEEAVLEGFVLRLDLGSPTTRLTGNSSSRLPLLSC